ncbi:MAG: tRNA (adenosine(37)-N6)-threonylcarbamoyltransferase complex ATPase subunit type 1 TsaE [Candidatus Omnitrophica bacterium]|nr:tRNA (adenosine(37)-N6)-threonylcarbamoyltransferase complex ATPase subunit type 1 TsaE [Candidatus Omnitrophota bacterium]
MGLEKNTVYTRSFEETISLGKKFSATLTKKDVVVLEGALGGGKTTFIKGVVKGLDIKAKVLSPSFTLVRQYGTGRLSFYHIDLYRLKENEIFNIGIEDFLYAKDTITVIEWGEKIEDFIPAYIKIEFSLLDQNVRKIDFSLKGYKGREMKI